MVKFSIYLNKRVFVMDGPVQPARAQFDLSLLCSRMPLMHTFSRSGSMIDTYSEEIYGNITRAGDLLKQIIIQLFTIL